jgi:hypothetical protein
MSDFDDVLIRNTPSTPEPTPIAKATDRDRNRAGDRPPSRTPSEPNPKSLLELLTGTDDATALATKFNLDPDLSERLVIPLVNLLDKYGMGESIAESSTARAGAGIIEFVSDIAPVVKGAADFVNNRRKEISSEDKEFLERIKASQDSSGDLALFLGTSDSADDFEEDWGEPVETAPPVPQSLEGEISSRIGGNPFTDGVDWTAALEPMAEQQAQKSGGNTIIDLMPERKSMISGIEQLAREAGLDPEEVVAKDSQGKFNRGTQGVGGVDYSNGAPAFNLNTDKIASAMANERRINESKSKVQFDTLPTPDSATDYVPTKGQAAPQTPTTTFTLPSVDDLMSEAGVKSFSNGRSATGGSAVAEPAKPEESPEWEVLHPDPEEPSHMENIVSSLDPSLLRGHQHEIFQSIRDAGSHGLTDEEGQNLLLVDGSSYRPARKRLADAGYIVSNATRDNSNGNEVRVWVASME